MIQLPRLSGAVVRRGLARLWPESLEGKVAVSAAAHGVALFLIFNWWWLFAHKLKHAGTANGTKSVMLYNPVGKVQPATQARRSSPTPRRVNHTVVIRPVSPDVSAPTQTSRHIDALGDSTVSITFIQPFPSQPPDLSHAGVTGDVVVDVEIDEQGRISQVHTRRSMGPPIDEMVVATVERWVFHPAMHDGKPVPSEQELHFHYDKSRDPAGCGWNCFTLEAQ